MLITLNIKFKAKLRKDGLYEITPTIGGKRVSIYGHSAEELASKYRKKDSPSKESNFYKSKKSAKEKKSDCMTLFAWFDEWLTVYKKPSVSKKHFSQSFPLYQKAHPPSFERSTYGRVHNDRIDNRP